MASLRREDTSDEAPLLGERGDASLPGGRPLYHNFVLGIALLSLSTASISAQVSSPWLQVPLLSPRPAHG